MRIGIDGIPLIGKPAGVGIYTRYLLEHLVTIEEDHEYFLFSPIALRDLPTGLSNVRVVVRRTPVPLWFLWTLPRELKKWKIDVFHGTNYLLPLVGGIKGVVTINDLTVERYGAMHPLKRRLSHRLLLPRVLSRAAKVIVPSESTRQDVIDVFRVEPGTISVIPDATGEEFRFMTDQDAKDRIRNMYGLPEEFLLFVGTIEPRKNLAAILEALAILQGKGKPKLPLVLAGERGWLDRRILSALESLRFKDQVRWLGYVPQKDLPLLYNLARCLVYPSIYEGFGLPVLEAMACGTPVITSNSSSLPEVAGDAGVMVDPSSPQDLAMAIDRVWNDDDLRNNLRERGLARSKMFSWDLTARETLKVYKGAVGIL